MFETDQYNGRNVLIIGGLGFIGSNLAARMVTLGARVKIIDSLIPEYGGNLFNIEPFKDKVTVNIADVRDEHSMRYLVQGYEFLFNLAGQTSHLDSMQNPETDLDINCRAQLKILEACRKRNPSIKIVFASTRQVYGKPEYMPVNELHPVSPVDVNGINKLAGEWYHLLYNNVYGIRSTVLRLTNTIGPRMRVKDARQTFLGLWIRLLVENRPFEVWDGHQLRDFTYVDDAVDALLMAAISEQAYGRVFNLGANQVISLKELAELLVTVHGSGAYHEQTFPADRKRIDIGDYYADDQLIRNILGWAPDVSLEEALKRTIDYYQTFGKHYWEDEVDS
ncbi:MAG: NAD-dependent epimerase/dehydratase family protein [Candidatus Latescibacteria bacterium]|nr:NAD-dependent epimerase/dehydratase family protein [Candidatus Latescibacterota bacterium]